MKKYFFFITIVAALAISITPAMAANSDTNNAGAVNYGWHLSGSVMPVPPYGSMDIPGSDTASKLIVNRPNGNVTTTVTGVMKGLHPDTTYAVYLSNGYVPYVNTGWNVTGKWDIDMTQVGIDNNHYVHVTNLTQTGNTLTGTLVYPGFSKTITSGSVIGNAITFTADYTENGPGTVTFTGTIASDGTMSGTWSDTWGGLDRHGYAWTSISGQAVKTYSGDTGWTGLLPGVSNFFTFTTDSNGEGSWHYNFREVVNLFSVWINDANKNLTLLISDSIGL